jgi:hypothetical protein
MKITRRGTVKTAVIHMKTLKPIVLALLAGSVVGGCKVGPNYHRPAVQTPTEYREVKDGPQTQVQPQVASYADLPWWQVFQDPGLQELIRTALKQNYDLQLATERINSARAAVTITRSNLFPQVQGNGNFSGGKENNFQTRFNFLTLSADAAFQLDFFGKLRRATEASRAQLLATEDAQKTVILTLVSDVASDYFALLQLDLQLQITHDTVTTQEDSVKLTKLRVDHGVATKLDVLQAQQVLIRRMRPCPTWSGRSRKRRMPSASCWGITRRACRAGARWWSRCSLPKCRQVCRRRCWSGGRTFCRRSSFWWQRMPKLGWPKPSFFRKSP